MPWCPKCKAEYRDGFTHCNDCGAELVEAENKPEEDKDRHARIKKQQNKQTKFEYIEEALLANVNNEVETAYITSMLVQEGIAYRVVDEDVGQYLSIVHGRSFLGKNIMVRRKHIEKAMEIKDSYKEHFLPENELTVFQDNYLGRNELLKVIILGYVIISLGLGVIL